MDGLLVSRVLGLGAAERAFIDYYGLPVMILCLVGPTCIVFETTIVLALLSYFFLSQALLFRHCLSARRDNQQRGLGGTSARMIDRRGGVWSWLSEGLFRT